LVEGRTGEIEKGTGVRVAAAIGAPVKRKVRKQKVRREIKKRTIDRT